MLNALVSVIIPIYNVENYLRKSVDSILFQTYSNIEIFLVDDGSPDTCGAICDEYAAKDSRIKVIHKQNGGLSDARNVAIEVATGEYIVFVDSDDYVTTDYIETLYNLIQKYNCKVAVALPQTFNEGNEPIVVEDTYIENCWNSKVAIEQMFYQEAFDTSAWAKIYHRSLFESGIRYPKGLLYEDLPTTYLLYLQSDRVAFCNKRIYYYLLRSNSIEGSVFSPTKMDSALRVFDMMEKNRSELQPFIKSFNCRMISFSFHLLLKMPKGYIHKQMLYDRIKRHRKSVIFDSRARKKTRIACWLSYLGIAAVKRLFCLVDQRKS